MNLFNKLKDFENMLIDQGLTCKMILLIFFVPDMIPSKDKISWFNKKGFESFGDNYRKLTEDENP